MTEEERQQQMDEGADRWSLVSVRGSRQQAVVVRRGGWAVDEADGSLRLPVRARPGEFVRCVGAGWWCCNHVWACVRVVCGCVCGSVFERSEATASEEAKATVEALGKEIDLEWLKVRQLLI
jgi:hypothetical protein